MFNMTELQDGLLERTLNLDKVLKLKKSQQKVVIDLFNDLMNFYGDKGMNMPGDYLRAKVLYSTLVEYGYLVTNREKNLNSVLDKK